MDSLGYAFHDLGETRQALACYQQAADLFAEVGDRHGLSEVLSHLGDCHLAMGEPEAAGQAWQQALTILVDINHPDQHDLRARLKTLGGTR
ncbi:tetratricopeptide repeat protein [Catelliglobosispora koreensis]|uniref:tetratricopeptide repeat protein n=1 Tax=Catelliglobosispora koreensis TaxID=129052 RepID=UPI0009FDD0E5